MCSAIHSIVLVRPSSSEISGSQPRISLAFAAEPRRRSTSEFSGRMRWLSEMISMGLFMSLAMRIARSPILISRLLPRLMVCPMADSGPAAARNPETVLLT